MGRLGNCCSSLGTFIWNGEQKSFCGRNGRAWAEICTFFFVFYAVLLAYFCGMLSLFYAFVSDKIPNLTGERSFLQQPGLSIRPLLRMETDYTTLIYYDGDNKDHATTKAAISNIKAALKPAKSAHKTGYKTFWQPCGVRDGKVTAAVAKVSCTPDYLDLIGTSSAGGPACSEDNQFGYTGDQPCVLVRINKIYGWKPSPYKKESPGFSKTVKRAMYDWTSHYALLSGDLIYLECYGADEVNKQLLGDDPFFYLPRAGFKALHFPFLNQENYVAPAVFVKFKKIPHNVAIQVICRIVTKGVTFDPFTWEGGYHFEIYHSTKKK
ncbi:sodium/potassium-transporting ATPase subunit beta-1-like [Littorina saxatilis]|uniref:Sodium/potassium-transporting ATPase subunit beta n=1 Tax=Littorina saxatilis TaxID=31220 RepID=A0AAN9AZ45_9CAEN